MRRFAANHRKSNWITFWIKFNISFHLPFSRLLPFASPAIQLGNRIRIRIRMKFPYSRFHIHMLSLCVNRARFMQNDWVNIQKKYEREKANERTNDGAKKRACKLTSTSTWNRNAWHIELIKFYLFRTSADENRSWRFFSLSTTRWVNSIRMNLNPLPAK